MGYKQQMQYAAKFSNGLDAPFQMSGAPTSGAGGSFVARAVVGSELVDVANGKRYSCTATSAGSVTWVVTGSQT